MNLKPWLYTIVRNRALNAKRGARRGEPLDEEADGVPPAAGDRAQQGRARPRRRRDHHPAEAQRQALVRSALEGRAHDRIAASIGTTPGAVRQLIYRARIAVHQGVGLVIPLPLVRYWPRPARRPAPPRPEPVRRGRRRWGRDGRRGRRRLARDQGGRRRCRGRDRGRLGIAIKNARDSDGRDGGEPAARSQQADDSSGRPGARRRRSGLFGFVRPGNNSGPGSSGEGGATWRQQRPGIRRLRTLGLERPRY